MNRVPINLDNGEGNQNAVVEVSDHGTALVIWYEEGMEAECAHVEDLSPQDQKKVKAVLDGTRV